MTIKRFPLCCAWLALAVTASLAQTPATNAPAVKDPGALRNVLILIVRHAEKPETGMELTPAGVQRAAAYTNYFRNFTVDSKPLRLDTLFAAADSNNSHRPRLTLEPLSQALGLPLDLRFKAAAPGELAAELRARSHGRQILICWHHGQIPALLQALGADPAKLLPGGKWPDDVFSWVIQLRYDQEGLLIPAETKRISQNLLPCDAALAEPPVPRQSQ
jgi:broad specificity phosphatase PhoE